MLGEQAEIVAQLVHGDADILGEEIAAMVDRLCSSTSIRGLSVAELASTSICRATCARPSTIGPMNCGRQRSE